MNKVKLVTLSIIALSLSACNIANLNISGERSELTKNLPPYTQIEVGSAISLSLNEGEPGDIIIQTYESVFEYVETYVENEVLYIRMRHNISFNKSPDVHIYVPVNNLNSLKMSGATDVKIVDNKLFNNEAIYLSLSGASYFEGAIDVKNMEVDLSGSSEVNIQNGYVENLTIDASGASDFDGKRFTTTSLTAELSGSSNMYINITEKIIEADLSGSSDLYYIGKNIIINKIDTSGSSEITKVDNF